MSRAAPGVLVVVSALCLAWATTARAQGLGEALALEGTVRHEFAYRLSAPHQITKLKTVGFIAGKYTVSPPLRFRLAARAFYDAAYAITAAYPEHVRRDQEAELALRQALLALFPRGLQFIAEGKTWRIRADADLGALVPPTTGSQGAGSCSPCSDSGAPSSSARRGGLPPSND